MYVIGANPYAGLFDETEYRRGKIPSPGTRAAVTAPDGSTKEFIVVKFNAGATHINGQVITISGDNVAVLGTAGPSPLLGGRVGVLAIASATATQTAAGTAYAWAQIYGKALALTTASVTAVNLQLNMAADGMLTQMAAVSASSAVQGITSVATQAASGLLPVLLQYPRFASYPA